jgi:hypothetical protein
MANTRHSRVVSNNGALYLGAAVSARQTAFALSLGNDDFLIHKSCG